MAKRVDSTVPLFTEPPMGGLRAMFSRFTALVGSLVELTAAERDLEGYTDQDPAIAAYTCAVDTARTRTLTHCAALIAGETVDEMAHGMQITARMVRTVLTTDKPSEVAMIRNICAMRNDTILFPLYRPDRPRYNALLDTAFDALTAYILLPGAVTLGNHGVAPVLADIVDVAHTEMSRHFISLVAAMDQFVHADQMIQRRLAGDVRTPQFTSAMAGAEAALAKMHDALHHVMAVDLLRPEDGALWEMGYALYSLIGQEDDEARLFLFGTVIDHQVSFMVRGSHAVARRTRQLQTEFFILLTALMQLEDFGGPGPEDDGAFGSMLAA
jgi:hypothetical protein